MQLTRFTDLGLRAVMLLAAGEADGRRVTTGSIAAGANAAAVDRHGQTAADWSARTLNLQVGAKVCTDK